MTEDLPPLPKHMVEVFDVDGPGTCFDYGQELLATLSAREGENLPLFTAEQMHAYALAYWELRKEDMRWEGCGADI